MAWYGMARHGIARYGHTSQPSPVRNNNMCTMCKQESTYTLRVVVLNVSYPREHKLELAIFDPCFLFLCLFEIATHIMTGVIHNLYDKHTFETRHTAGDHDHGT